MSMAFGTQCKGIEGFTGTHHQAAQAALVARVSRVPDLRVVHIEDVGAVALMCSDLGSTRAWVRDVLGALGPLRARAVRPGHWGPVSPVHYGAGGRRSEV